MFNFHKSYCGLADILPVNTPEEIAWAKKYFDQFNERGFDDTESWDLGRTTIVGFIYPRLRSFIHNYQRSILIIKDTDDQKMREYKELQNKYSEEFNVLLSKALRAFEIIYKAEVSDDINDSQTYYNYESKNDLMKEVDDGLKAFAEVLLALWS